MRKRILHHLNNFKHSRYNAPIYRAFRKYEFENFIDITDKDTGKKIRIKRKQLAFYFNITEQYAKYAIVRGRYKNFKIEKVYV